MSELSYTAILTHVVPPTSEGVNERGSEWV